MTVIDISQWQGHPDFAQVKASGVSRVIMRAADGEGHLFVDSVYVANRTAARAAGLAVGSYFFNGPAATPTASADYYIAAIDYQPGDVVAVDVEGVAGVMWNPGQVLEFVNRVKAVLGVAPLVYMSASVTWAQDWSAVVATGAPLWVAQYGPAPTVGYWGSWALWQYTSAGSCPGITGRVDISQISASFASTGSTQILEDDMSAAAEAQIADIHALLVNGTPAHLDVGAFTQGLNAVLDIQARMMAATGGGWDSFDELIKAVRFLKAAVDPTALSKAIADKVTASLPAGADAAAIAAAVDAALADNFAAVPAAVRADLKAAL